MKKNFIPYFLVLGSNAHFKYKKNHRYENSMRHQKWIVDAEAKRTKIIKTTPLTGHHAAEEYNLNTLHLTVPLSNEISMSH